MKKIVFLFFILSFMSFSSFTPFNHKKYNFTLEKISLLNIDLSETIGGRKYFEGVVKNNTDKKILKAEVTVMFKDKDTPYSVVGKMNFYNLKPKESSTFSGQSVYVNNIQGEDFRVKLSEIIMEK
ncbi:MULTISPECIES: hypothetical protein [Psychrilyobacter]|uniref:DUF3221 domain-containing protein n=1 Tax=Psychrilyobacter piezotolerans TaxID=2293438 RepID=A0ABX9KIE5_9FUSO|nr:MULTISPECIES: hypothetical protein [Psychrilyobacter]MCS5420633.1 hypothetical protein [Psychrilyobacter sp. S5]NDI77348.1 hypothetical protein [Psychrilyobacter piezotolerans]RDE63655.1 hypothetical protein DV867_04560 [Psychrilyobacter sp. S5]REI41999.1 hypothetical protein DYH56_04560 [Psychrilyobacter piezotolerans]